MLQKEKELITKIEADVSRLTSIFPNPAITQLFEIARDLQSLRQMIEKKKSKRENCGDNKKAFNNVK